MRNGGNAWIGRGLGLAVALGGLAAAQGQSPASQPASQPAATGQLVLDQWEWAVGELWSGQTVSHDFTVTNVGDAPLRVWRDNDVPARCFDLSIPPGEKGRFTLYFDARHSNAFIRDGVTLRTNDPRHETLTIPIGGRIRELLVASPRETDTISLGRISTTQPATAELEFASNYNEDLKLKLKPIPDHGGRTPIDVKLEELSAGRRFKLVVKALPPLEPGRLLVPLEVETNVPEAPTVPFSVVADVRPLVFVEPTRMVAPPHQMMRAVVKVWSDPSRDVKLTGLEAGESGVKAQMMPRETKKGWSIQPILLRRFGSAPPLKEPVKIVLLTTDPDFPRLELMVLPPNWQER